MPVSELIWAGSLSGLRRGLAKANELEACGKLLDAKILRASAWYSYRAIPGAQGRAYRAVSPQSLLGYNMHEYSASQCDVLGCVHLAQGDVDKARHFFDLGLAKLEKNPSPLTKALLSIGRAEVAMTVKNTDKVVRQFIRQALFI